MGSFHGNTSLCVNGTEESRKKGGRGTKRSTKAYSHPSVYTGGWFQDQIQPEVGWSMHTETVDTEDQLHCYWGLILQVMGHQVFWTRLTKWVVLGYITKGLYKLLNNYLNSQNISTLETTAGETEGSLCVWGASTGWGGHLGLHWGLSSRNSSLWLTHVSAIHNLFATLFSLPSLLCWVRKLIIK